MGVDVAVGAVSLGLELELMRRRLLVLRSKITRLLWLLVLLLPIEVMLLSPEWEVDLILMGDRDLVLDLPLLLECALDLELVGDVADVLLLFLIGDLVGDLVLRRDLEWVLLRFLGVLVVT
jgi:hypothetical protein